MLTPEQENTLATFRSIVSYADNEEAGAIEILRANEWALEPAILQYVDGDHRYYSNLNSTSNETAENRSVLGSDTVGTNGNSVGRFFQRIRSLVPGNTSQYSALPGAFPEDSNAADNMSVAEHLKQALLLIVTFVLTVPFFIVYKALVLIVIALNKTYWILNKFKNKIAGFQSKDSSRNYFVSSFFARRKSGSQGFQHIQKRIDPVDTARSFVDRFHEDVERILAKHSDEESRLLTRVSVPDFVIGGYTHALYVAKRDIKWLLVYIQSDEHDDKDKFIERILLNERFNKFLNDNDILIWGGNACQSEAYQTASTLGSAKLPFLALMCLTTQVTPTTQGNETGSPTISVVCRVQGYHPLNKILMKFNQQVEKHEPNMVVMRATLKEQTMARLLRERQDLAYQKSLLQDRLKKKLNKFQKQRKSLLLGFSAYKALDLQEHFIVKDSLDAEDNKSDYARIALRLTDGSRLVSFYSKNNTTANLYFYVELVSKGVLTNNDGKLEFHKEVLLLQVQGDERNTLDFTIKQLNTRIYFSFKLKYPTVEANYQFNFKLVNLFPRKELVPEDTLIGDVDYLCPNGNLFLEEVEQEPEKTTEDYENEEELYRDFQDVTGD